MVQINACNAVMSSSRRSGAEATQSKVVHNILATLQVVLERVKLAAQLVVAEVELLSASAKRSDLKHGASGRGPVTCGSAPRSSSYQQQLPAATSPFTVSRLLRASTSPVAICVTHHRVAGEDVVHERGYPAGEGKVLGGDRVDGEARLRV